ncbi:uncharacterized protein TNCV_4864831 [Trichonephila clavipes]|nr:uncharacterized protein TNCV_4864831 [Trichonephila clavipes]
MGLSQADAAKRLDVDPTVVHRLKNQFKSEDSEYRRYVQGQLRVTTSAGDCSPAISGQRRRNTTVPHLIVDHFVASEARVCYCGAKISSQCSSLCETTSGVCPPGPPTEMIPFKLCKETHFLKRIAMSGTVHR